MQHFTFSKYCKNVYLSVHQKSNGNMNAENAVMYVIFFFFFWMAYQNQIVCLSEESNELPEKYNKLWNNKCIEIK